MRANDLHQLHLRHLTASRRSPETLRFYAAAVSRWRAFLEATERPDDLRTTTRADIAAFQLWLREQGLGSGGEHAILRGLRATLRFGVEEELLDVDAFRRIRLPSLNGDPPPTVQPGEVALILTAARASSMPARNVAVVMTLYDTGIRMNELIQLRVGDLDVGAGCLRVRSETAKGKKGRVVPVGLRATRALLKYERVRRPARPEIETLFLSREGTQLTRSGLTQLMSGLSEAAGIPRSHTAPHAFRRGFAVGFLRQGGDLFALQQILGHGQLSMTRRYVSFLPEDLQRQHLRASPGDRL